MTTKRQNGNISSPSFYKRRFFYPLTTTRTQSTPRLSKYVKMLPGLKDKNKISFSFRPADHQRQAMQIPKKTFRKGGNLTKKRQTTASYGQPE
jgi:hypothetical protein